MLWKKDCKIKSLTLMETLEIKKEKKSLQTEIKIAIFLWAKIYGETSTFGQISSSSVRKVCADTWETLTLQFQNKLVTRSSYSKIKVPIKDIPRKKQ